MLLNHTSGLDDFFLHASIDKALQADPAAAWSVKRTLRFVAKPYFPPGTGWHYSNTNYVYLGLIAEHVTGTSLGAALHDRFFGPLGLDGTWYQAAEDPRTPTAHGYRFAGSAAVGHAGRPVRRVADHAVHLGRHGVRRRGVGRGNVRRRRALGAAPLHGRGARRGHDGADARRRRRDGRLRAAGAVRPRRPGVPDRRAPDGRPQRPPARLQGVGPSPAGRGDDGRGPDEPEPGRSGRRSSPSSCRWSSRPSQPASAARTGPDRATTRHPPLAVRRRTRHTWHRDQRPMPARYGSTIAPP